MEEIKVKKLLLFITVLIFPSVVYANSSWVWISETRPYDVLPFVIIITIIIEVFSIIKIANIKKYVIVFLCVLLGNVLSFSAPYLLAMTDEIYSFREMLEHMPYYTVGLAYLITTLVVEYLIVYNCLKRFTTNKRTLAFTILGSNLITTIITAVAERVFCRGQW